MSYTTVLYTIRTVLLIRSSSVQYSTNRIAQVRIVQYFDDDNFESAELRDKERIYGNGCGLVCCSIKLARSRNSEQT